MPTKFSSTILTNITNKLKEGLSTRQVASTAGIGHSTVTQTRQSTPKDVRLRFAPSPTGSLHFGGLRAALFNYLFARKHDGKFILRIEDTDQTRVVPGSQKDIEHILDWAGLRPDEGPSAGGPYGPYVQSERLHQYREMSQELLESGRAYKCFCSQSRLELLRKSQVRNFERLGYDGKCRNLSDDEIKSKLEENRGRYVIRFLLRPKVVVFDDIVYGEISIDLSTSSDVDPVIIKSDGWPTYHFANVVDDYLMKISHVLRGAEWIPSTPKHIQLYEAFGWSMPRFAHLPLVTMEDGSKMSKRNNHSHISSWIDAGYQPLALHNLLADVGEAIPKYKQDSMELWDLERLSQNFRLDKVTSHSAMIDLNRLKLYSRSANFKNWQDHPDQVLDQLKSRLTLKNISTDLNDQELSSIIGYFIRDRITTIEDLVDQNNEYLWKRPSLSWNVQEYLDKGLDLQKIVIDLIEVVKARDLIDKESLFADLKELAKRNGIEWPRLMVLIRRLCTNRQHGMPVHDIFLCLGKDKLLSYLEGGLKFVNEVEKATKD